MSIFRQFMNLFRSQTTSLYSERVSLWKSARTSNKTSYGVHDPATKDMNLSEPDTNVLTNKPIIRATKIKKFLGMSPETLIERELQNEIPRSDIIADKELLEELDKFFWKVLDT